MSGIVPRAIAADVVPKAIAILQAMLEHKRKARHWEQEFYGLDAPSENCRPGRPRLESPEVQLLLRLEIVSYIEYARTNSDIPECSLRLLMQDEPRAQEAIHRYLNTLGEAGLRRVDEGAKRLEADHA